MKIRVNLFIFRNTGYWILDTGYWILDTGYWILDATNLFLLIKEPVLSEAEGGLEDCCEFRVPKNISIKYS